jgi:hypothetical protein
VLLLCDTPSNSHIRWSNEAIDPKVRMKEKQSVSVVDSSVMSAIPDLDTDYAVKSFLNMGTMKHRVHSMANIPEFFFFTLLQWLPSSSDSRMISVCYNIIGTLC